MSLYRCRTCSKEIKCIDAIGIQSKITNTDTILQAIQEFISCQYSDQFIYPEYICKKCFKLLRTSLTFRRLVICSKKFVDKQQVVNVDNKQRESDTKDIFCKAEVLKNDNSMEKNILLSDEHNIKCNKQKIKVTKETVFKECSYCGKQVRGAQNFEAHIKKHKDKASSFIYSCILCPKKFARKEYLMVHKRTHSGEKPYHCDICNKNFSQLASFYVHKRRLHEKIILGTCNYCGKKFVDKPELDVHIKMWHTGERPYLCEVCSATFVCNRTLQRHRKELHSEKKPCQKCGKMLGDYALKKHLYRHKVQEDGVEIVRKKYTCEYCNTVMNFTSRRRHLEKQHSIKLYGRGDNCKKIPIELDKSEK